MTDELAQEPAIAEKVPEDAAAVDAKTEPSKAAEPAPAKESSEDKLQRRFDDLTRKRYDAQRRADLLTYENEQLKARLTESAKPSETATQAPTLASVGFDEGKYQAELLRFAETRAEAAAMKALDKRLQQTDSTRSRSEFETRQSEFIKTNPDYTEKVLENDLLPISESMAQVIHESKIGPQIALYLADNEDIASHISRLPPLVQAREIGRIEATLELKKVAAPKVSQAPPPPAKLDSTESTAEKEPSEMTDKQFNAWRRKQIAQRRNAH